MTNSLLAWLPEGPPIYRALLLLLITAAAHLLTRGLRRLLLRLSTSSAAKRWQKLQTLSGLAYSVVLFTLWFGVFGLALAEFGVSLKAYFASATIIGLAVGFGSQAVVQDVVNGVTLVLSDLVDVGDLVEIGGQTGIITGVGMRFVVIRNYLGGEVFIPNRTINNVTRYPKGYVRALIDVRLTPALDAQAALQRIEQIVTGAWEQMPGLCLAPPSVDGLSKASNGERYIRAKLRIWPGQSAALATVQAELVATMRKLDPQFEDWRVSTALEIESKAIPHRARRPAPPPPEPQGQGQ